MKYGFIGCGNMGSAIAAGLSKSTNSILISDRSGKAKAIAAQYGLTYGAPAEAAACEMVFLAVKPQIMEQVLTELQPVFAAHRPLLITMAAGLSLAKISRWAGASLPVIRIMPNTPVAVGKGVIPYCCNDTVTPAQLETFLADMAPCGLLDPLEEGQMDAVTALSGCGPAYVYLFMEALADGAVSCGIPREKALRYAAATIIGAGEMVLSTGVHPSVLKDAVCSPGGSTIAGVRALEQNGLRNCAIEAVIAAYKRNCELGK